MTAGDYMGECGKEIGRKNCKVMSKKEGKIEKYR